MNQYNYLTGIKELFTEAPENAMVVLEHEDGRLFYAVAHDMGANYWNEDGSPGSKIGLIALYKKTRVVASRILVSRDMTVEPQNSVATNSRIDRIHKAQDGLRKAAMPKADVKPEPSMLKQAVAKTVEPPTKKLIQRPDKPISKPQDDGSGFVSMFDMAEQRKNASSAFMTVGTNGNINVAAVIGSPGDMVDLQYNKNTEVIRIAKVLFGGRKLNKARQFGGAGLARLFFIPEGKSSVRISLVKKDGWWCGEAKLVEDVE